MAKLRFTKMHGLGNDYIYLDGFQQALPGDLPGLARRMSDRHFGVGGDGIIVVLPGDEAPLRMRMFNADGSEGEMCGNGMRAFAKYAYEAGYVKERRFAVETPAGIIRPEVMVGSDGRVKQVRVDMGKPRLTRAEIPMAGEPEATAIAVPLIVEGRSFTVTAVSMGNPHCVVFLDQLAGWDVALWGPRFEHHPGFPRRVNTEFVEQTGPDRLRMRVWERGSGETLACGTGACAVVVAASLTGRIPRRATVELLGGNLEIEWAADDHVYKTGPAEEVFRGEYTLAE